jgi:hypothetical protein
MNLRRLSTNNGDSVPLCPALAWEGGKSLELDDLADHRRTLTPASVG